MQQQGRGDRIPFRIRIGVTGHRDIDRDPALETVVRAQIHRVGHLLEGRHTEIHLAVVSQLADGADRLLAREVLAYGEERGRTSRLEVLLPFKREHYVALQEFDHDSRREFDLLFFDVAVVKREQRDARWGSADEQAEAFEATGRQLVGRCDVLIALWDGRGSGGRGGTASTLSYAASRAKPCIWISTEDHTVRDNLGENQAKAFRDLVARQAFSRDSPGAADVAFPLDALAPLRGSFDELDRFNRASLRGSAGAWRHELALRPGEGDWVAGPFGRASALANRWQWRFKWVARSITLLAALAAAMLAYGLATDPKEPFWSAAEAVLFLLAMGCLFGARAVGVHRRWLLYRVLAERLRSARFLAPTGADFRRQARLEAVYSGERSSAWLMRAFEEVWDGRPQSDPALADRTDTDLADLKQLLAERWIGSQIEYHAAKSIHHALWQRWMAGTVVGLFAATILFATLHSLHVAERVAIFMTIALPAAGASLGVLLTVNQHHALSERYSQMKSDLTVAQRNVIDAPPESLDRVSSEAARTIAQETGAWFGSMWFNDIEHP